MSDDFHEIASQLRQLPQQFERGEFGLVDAATFAGALLLDAIHAGAFADAKWIMFRRIVELATRGELEHQLGHPPGAYSPSGTLSPPPEWHAFVNGYVQIVRDSGRVAGGFGDSFGVF